jgi:hypothetical protein
MAFFDCDGFLTGRRGELEARIDGAYGRVLAPARQINHDCHKLIFGADVRNHDPQALLVATGSTKRVATAVGEGAAVVAQIHTVLGAE